MAAPRIGIALVGCGGIASYYHLPALIRHPRTRVVGIADPSPQARARAESLAHSLEIVDDAREIIDRPDVDAVVVCSDNRQHAPLAQSAISAEKHVYLEKPLALTVEDGRAVVSSAEKAGIVGAIGFNLRFNPLHQRANALIAQGAIGEPRAVRAVFHEPARRRRMPDWKRRRASGGGALLDLGSHTMDLLRWHLNTEVAEASARIESLRSEDDRARVRVVMTSGVEAQISCRIGATRTDVFEVEGTAAVMRVDRYGELLSVSRRRKASLNPAWRRFARRLSRPKPEPSFARALAAFVESLDGARPPELPTLTDGLRSLEAVLCAERD